MDPEADPQESIRLDLKGLKCPLPVLHTRRALERTAAGLTLIVECTDPMAVIDIPNMIRETGNLLLSQHRQDELVVFHICKA